MNMWHSARPRTRPGPGMLVTDIDGTLLSDLGEVSALNARLIQTLIAADVPATLATGRTAPAALPIARQLGVRLPVVVCNGAQVVDTGGRVWFQRRLEPAQVDTAVALAREMGLAGFVYLDDTVVPVAGGEQHALHLLPVDRERLSAPPSSDEQADLWQRSGGAVKLLLLGSTAACDAYAAAVGPDLSVLRSCPDCLEVMAPGVSKATGLAYLLQRYRIRPSAVVAVGNALNDLQMLQFAGYGVAVASAEPELLVVADYVAPSHNADALAAVVSHFFPQVHHRSVDGALPGAVWDRRRWQRAPAARPSSAISLPAWREQLAQAL